MAMELTLRPMSTSQVLDRTFQLYRSHFVLLAGIGLLLPALLMILQLAFIPLGYPPRTNIAATASPEAFLAPLFGFLACYAVVYTIAYALAGGATVYGVAKLHLGETVTIGQAYKQVFARFWRIVGIIVLVSVAVFGVFLVGEFIAVFLFGILMASTRVVGGAGGATVAIVVGIIFGGLILLAGLSGGLYLYCKFSLAVPACVLEKQGVGASISRSWSLTKGTVWRLILIFLLTWVLSIVLGLALSVPGLMYDAFTHGQSFLTGVLLREIGGFFAGVVANPIATISLALIYYDQRVRHEAFDLQLMMQAIGQPAPPQAAGAAPGSIG